MIYQAVLLAGGTGSRLYPLNSTGIPKALLPVGNESLISFPLKTLEDAGVKDVFVICYGEVSAAKVHSWISKHYSGRLHLTVKSIPDDSLGSHTASALRVVASKLTDDNFVVISGDLITDIPLKAVLASHYVNSATCTSVFTRRKTSPAAETKPGKAPSNVDFVGLHDSQLAFFDSSGEVTKRSVKVPLSPLFSDGSLTIQTDLVDQHCYVFDRKAVFHALDAKPTIAAIKEDLVPYLVRHQLRMPRSAERSGSLLSSLPSTDNLVHGMGWPFRGRVGWWAGAFVAPTENYCSRANTLAAYADVNRDVISSELSGRFLSLKPNVEGYFRHETVAVAPKTTIAAGCMLGRGCRVGEKCTIKRSVLGSNCVLGSNVKLINSVLMDRVTMEDDCVVQNCIICSGSHLQARVQLRDCQVGTEYTITEDMEHRGEVFDRSKPAVPE